MKAFYTLITALLFALALPVAVTAQNEWPKTITGSNGSPNPFQTEYWKPMRPSPLPKTEKMNRHSE